MTHVASGRRQHTCASGDADLDTTRRGRPGAGPVSA
jgi:hypothetical protein